MSLYSSWHSLQINYTLSSFFKYLFWVLSVPCVQARALKVIIICAVIVVGCPANEVNEEGYTPQKIAKNEGTKDAMKELKKLTGYQDKIAKGGKPKGFSESWCIRVSY